jgi:hypothetical protein
VAADVEPVPFVMIGAGDAADHPRICLEHDALPAVPGQLVSPCEARGAAPGDDGLVGGDDRLCSVVFDSGPAMGQETGANRLRLGRIRAHPRLRLVKTVRLWQQWTLLPVLRSIVV